MNIPKDYIEISREIDDEIHHDIIILRLTAVALFVLGFLVGAVLF